MSADEVPEVDVDLGCVPHDAAWWEVELPPCPDCGGAISWVEAGYVPGTRKCTRCGSMFVVEAHHVQERASLRKVRLESGELRVYRVPETGYWCDWSDASELGKHGVLIASLQPGADWRDAAGWPIALDLSKQFDAMPTHGDSGLPVG